MYMWAINTLPPYNCTDRYSYVPSSHMWYVSYDIVEVKQTLKCTSKQYQYGYKLKFDCHPLYIYSVQLLMY